MAEIANMTLRQIEARARAVEEDLERLREQDQDEERGGLDDADDALFNELVDEHERLTRAKKSKEREERLDLVRASATNPRARLNGAAEDAVPQQRDSVSERRFRDPWDLTEVRTGLTPQQHAAEIRSRALSATERLPFVDDKRKEVVTNLLERSDTKDAQLATQVLLTSSESYVRAFAAAIGTNGDLSRLEDDDRRVLARAMTTVDAAGGFLIPFQLDPSVINTADGSFNQVRQIARKVTATGDEWHGVSSAGVIGSWDAEGTEVSDDAPTLAQPSIKVHSLRIFVPISIEASQDAANVATEVAGMIAFEKDVKESVAFVEGTGAGQPTGIVTALTGTASELGGVGELLASADVYKLDNALPLRYNFRASWLANKVTYNAIKQLASDDSMWGTTESGTPGELLGHGTAFGEAMDDPGTGVLAEVDRPLVLGDFQNYVVADRIGTTVEFIPHVFGANGRPTGQRGWFAYVRVGADSVNDGAFRMLKQTGV